MAHYLCELEGENFAFSNDEAAGGYTLLGFYTCRIVEAASPAEAERAAIEIIRDDASLKRTVIELDFGPHPFVRSKGVYELPDNADISSPTDFAFYPMPAMPLAETG